MREILRAQCAGHGCRVPFLVSAVSEQALHDALTAHAEYRLRVDRPGFERGPITPRLHPEHFTVDTIDASSFWSRTR